MTPLKAIAAFTLAFGLLVGTGIALATTDFAQAPVADGYGVAVTPALDVELGAATSTHSGNAPTSVKRGAGHIAWQR